MQDILKTIEAASPSLSKGQRLIAAFIQKHYD